MSKLLLILALVFFILDAMITGGMITASGLGWLLPGGLAAWVLSVLLM